MNVHTVGELRAAGYKVRSVKDEMRANLLARIAKSENTFPGIHGYERTVIPALHNAILSQHDIILLGLRGQAKTRLLRSLVELARRGDPGDRGLRAQRATRSTRSRKLRPPACSPSRATTTADRLDSPRGALPRKARHARRDDRRPDRRHRSDQGRRRSGSTYSDEEVIHFGIVPRTNRGIFAINELPDLQPRIQVGLLNILEERDLQIRGFPVRIPLDILLVFSANPEDYTNRGNIITPLKDRISSQILTHYPDDVKTARAITEQEAWIDRERRRRRSRCRHSSASSSRRSPSRRASPSSWTSPRASPRACRSRRSRSSHSNLERRGLPERRGDASLRGSATCSRRSAGHHRQGRDGLRGRAAGRGGHREEAHRHGREEALRREVPGRPSAPASARRARAAPMDRRGGLRRAFASRRARSGRQPPEPRARRNPIRSRSTSRSLSWFAAGNRITISDDTPFPSTSQN